MKIDFLADTTLKVTTIILLIWSTYSYRTLVKKMESSTTNKESNNEIYPTNKHLPHNFKSFPNKGASMEFPIFVPVLFLLYFLYSIS